MKNLPLLARILLGMIYFVFGLNGFLNFIPAPPSMPEGAMAFSGAMMHTGYFFPVLKATEVVAGFMLLSGLWAPLGMVILAPITLQIFLFHHFLTPGAQFIILPSVMAALHVYLGWANRAKFRPLFTVG